MSDEELPLKFEEIVDVKTYDKMRPPRPGGMSGCHIAAAPKLLLFFSNNILPMFTVQSGAGLDW